MTKRKLRFFLDCGICFWEVDDAGYSLRPEDLPLPPDVQSEVAQLLAVYDQHYDWGCPPSTGWTLQDCQQFNAHLKRVLALVLPELKEQFVVCQEQLDLTEDPEYLAEFYRRGRSFVDEKRDQCDWKDDL